MAVKILVWNAQHMDNQSTSTHSEAFKDKLEFLGKYLAQLGEVDVMAFLETGKTGNINETLAASLNNLPGNYSPLAHLAQEGGLFKNTTLGISVYVRNALKEDFEISEYDYILDHKERRAPVIIKHKKTCKYLAFYHANANEKTSFGYIKGAIENIDKWYEGNLVFFGGDMNYDFHSMNDTVGGLSKIGPGVATHSKIELVKKSLLAEKMAKRYESLVNNKGLTWEFNHGYGKRNDTIAQLKAQTPLMGAQHTRLKQLLVKKERVDESFAIANAAYDRQYSVLEENAPRDSILVTNRFLDYGFVKSLNEWEAECHGTVAIVNSKALGFGCATRLCHNLPMRIYHPPAIYTWKETGDENGH
jgi:hypothetical protein